MKQILVFTLFLILFNCSSNNGESLNQFENCYPKDKLRILKHVIEKMDKNVQRKYPAKNMFDSYRKYAQSWIDNGGRVDKILNETEIYNDLLEANTVNDLLIEKSGKKDINLKGEYFQCLKKIEDEKIQNYVRNVESVGENLSLPMTMSAFIEENKLDSLHILILKTEIIIGHLKHFQN